MISEKESSVKSKWQSTSKRKTKLPLKWSRRRTWVSKSWNYRREK